MSIHKILLLLFFIFSISIVNALPILVSTNNIAINVTKGTVYSYYINVTNPNSYILYDVHSDSSVITSNSLTLLPNETKQLSITISTLNTGTFTLSSTIVGFTQVNCSDISTNLQTINITRAGANPRNINICKNSNVVYINNYGSSIYVNIEYLNTSTLVANDNSFSQNYPNSGSFVYRIEPLIDLGTVTVTDSGIKVHSIDDDTTLNFNVVSRLDKTTINATFSNLNFNMSYNALQSGYVLIKNTGSKTAEGIKLTGEWIVFDKNNFDLSVNEEKAINYVISPTISVTEDTDKSYNKTIRITGNNIDTIDTTVNIYILFSNVITANLSSPEWWINRKQFCDKYPTAPDCLTEPSIIYRDKLVYDCPSFLMNMSPLEVKRLYDAVYGLKDDYASTANNGKLDLNTLKEYVSSMKNDVNESLKTQITNTNEINDFKNVFFIIIGLCLLILSGCIIYITYNKYYKIKKSILDNTL